MKRMVGIFLALTMVLSMFAGFSVFASSDWVYPVTEDFEDALDDKWSTSAVLDATEHHGGDQSLKIETAEKAIIINWKLPVKAETKYTVTAWTKLMTAGTGGAELKAVHYNSEGEGTEQSMSISVDKNSTAWQEVTSEFTTLADTVITHLYIRNTKTQNTLWWDDITVTEVVPEKHPELLPAGIVNCEGATKWGAKNSAVIAYTAAGVEGKCMSIDWSSTGGNNVYATMAFAENSSSGAPALETGKAYRLSFWYKTDSNASTIVPTIRLTHYYKDAATKKNTKQGLQMEWTTAGTTHKQSTGEAISATDSASALVEGTTNVWKQYTLYFMVPNYTEANGEQIVYTNSELWLGQYNKQKYAVDEGGNPTTDKIPATVYYDEISLKEDYNSISLVNATTGETLESGVAVAAGTQVKARVHMAVAGSVENLDTMDVLGATYVKEAGAKRLDAIKAGSIKNGNQAKATGKEALIVFPGADWEDTFIAGNGGSIGVYLWDSFSGMHPIEKATISAPAADAAE